MTTEVAIDVVDVNEVIIVEERMVDVTSGTKDVFVTVAVVIEVLVVVGLLIDKVLNFVETQFERMCLVVTDLMSSTHSTPVGYAAGEYTTELSLYMFFFIENFPRLSNRTGMSRLIFFGTYPVS